MKWVELVLAALVIGLAVFALLRLAVALLRGLPS